MSHEIFGIYLKKNSNLKNVNTLKFKLTGRPVFYAATLAEELWNTSLVASLEWPTPSCILLWL